MEALFFTQVISKLLSDYKKISLPKYPWDFKYLIYS